jgi:phenylalanyl-tRNA synthetase beta chain
MKISYNWLKTLVNFNTTVSETASLLTGTGLEVESVESFETVRGGLKGLVVGQILECSKHPDADRLSLTKVDIGEAEPLSIVCGASNVAINQKVMVATVGTTLFPSDGEPFQIKSSKIRGALSQGMICAEDEIGVGSSHDGIMVLPDDIRVGLPAAEYFNIETDEVFEIGLTPNRGDAASHLGTARDLVAALNTKVNSSEFRVELPGLHQLPDVSGKNKLSVTVKNQEACKRYSGLQISGIKVSESPAWLKNRLKSIGLRPINNIVDVTNFVMFELGQPLHAFDLEKISGQQINVKLANGSEKITCLDGIVRELSAEDLVIYDQDKPLGIAGLIGGQESGVSESTTAIFLESAYFDPAVIRKSASRHAIKTDASFRFERGTDPDMTVTALVRAANLIFEMAGGFLGMEPVDVYEEILMPYKVAFSYKNCDELIGKEIDRHLVKNIILSLGIEIESEGTDALLLNVPRYKSDVTREADVVEEVMRIYGYDNIEPSKSIAYTVSHETPNSAMNLETKVADLLEGFGFNEIMGLSMSKETYYSQEEPLVKLLNPLSIDLGVMRSDMIFNGLEAIAYNINRKQKDLRFFEFGKTYQLQPEGSYKEEKYITVFITGNMFSENPYGMNQPADITFLSSVVSRLLQKCAVHNTKTEESTYLHFDAGLKYLINQRSIAEAGVVSKALLKKVGIDQAVYYAFINWEVLLKSFKKQKIAFSEVPKYPSVQRDLALLIDKSVKYHQIEELAFANEKKLLTEVNLFDIYEDEKLGNKKSYAVSFTLQNREATLTDKQIDAVMEKLIKAYKTNLGAELR